MIARPQRLRILIVENEFLLSLMAEDIVLDLGHEVVGYASSAATAVAQVERTRPDIVLMDVQLDGEGDGVDAAREIKDRLGIASLFMTGCADVETHRRALQIRPLGYLQKPLSPTDLASALARYPLIAASHPPAPDPGRSQERPAMASIGWFSSMSGDAVLRMSGK